MAFAFEMKPPHRPCNARKKISCQIFWAAPIRKNTIAIPNDARNNISLRPLLSASFPQKGDIIAVIKKVIEKVSPL